MALNFPPPSQSPYVDPSSGLKYIFNTTIGAWESAIQPPVIITADTNPPDIIIEGFLWYDDIESTLYVYRGGQWVPVVGANNTIVSMDPTPPPYPAIGELWWDKFSGNLYIWYYDGDSSQWMPATAVTAGGGALGGSTSIFYGDFPPPVPFDGQLWYNTDNGILYVYADGRWVATAQEVTGVKSVEGVEPIVVDDTDKNELIVSVKEATATETGVVKLATDLESAEGTDNKSVVTPASLKFALQTNVTNYLPDASDTEEGVTSYATPAEIVAGTVDNKSITPAALRAALPSMGVFTPAGAVVAFASAVSPAGYLECNGDAVARDVYAELFASIGTTYGEGDGSTTFLLPDLRGEFIRGWAHGKSSDSGRSLGSFQEDSIEYHTHDTLSSTLEGQDDNILYSGGRVTNTPPMNTVTTDNNEGGANETRPRNIAMMYCIKF